ncbi:hypothetical protein F4678DRAFT_458799 [Xylaria arbuscula]|nr:hypothetical protein F4678DRAFT_458799 [Xylaria arbuscula]
MIQSSRFKPHQKLKSAAKRKPKAPFFSDVSSRERATRPDSHDRVEGKDYKQDQSSPLSFPHEVLDDLIFELARSVRKGTRNDLTKLLRSIYGRLPRTSDVIPIPAQQAPVRAILANTSIYKALTPRASALMYGKLPPDQTEPWLWNNTVAPRIANVLLRKAKRTRPSGLEISAYLHIVLVDFIRGKRNPKVMIEKSFGDFLMEGVPPDTEWDNLVTKKKPRFLILGRGENEASYNWYVIIVDIDARIAYCFDSKVDEHTRVKDSMAFDLLQRQWTARIPQIPVPERLIDLPSFTRKSHYGSSFMCLYHVMLLFRRPLELRKLKGGNKALPRGYLDRIVIEPAENYIGVKVKESSSSNVRPPPKGTV